MGWMRRAETLRSTGLGLSLGTLLVAGGCSPVGRRDAEVLSKRSVDAATLFSGYQASVATEYDRYNADVDFVQPGAPTPEGQQASAAVAKALRERAALAASLKALADKAASVLDFSSDDAQAAAQGLVARIEALDHHPLRYPGFADSALAQAILPKADQDPSAVLGKVVKALVEFQALRDYRRSIPQLRAAVDGVDEYFDDERPLYTYFAANRPAYDSYVVAFATAAGMTIDFSSLQPAFDTFGMSLLPSTLSPTGQIFQPKLLRARSAVVRGRVVQAIEAGADVSNALFALDLALAKAGRIAELGAPFFSPKDSIDPTVVVQAMEAARSSTTEARDPKARIAKRLADLTTDDEWKALKGPKAKAIVADKLNAVVAGGPIYPVALTVYDTAEDAQALKAYGSNPASDVPKEVLGALSILPFLDAERVPAPPSASLDAPRFVPYFFVVPPAGRAAAALNRTLIDAYLPTRSASR